MYTLKTEIRTNISTFSLGDTNVIYNTLKGFLKCSFMYNAHEIK